MRPKGQTFIDSSRISAEILIGDKGSTDGSRELAAAEGARLVPVAVRGYGDSPLGGIEQARGLYTIMVDADHSYGFNNLGAFVEALRGEAEADEDGAPG